jgi:hypothetical protein
MSDFKIRNAQIEAVLKVLGESIREQIPEGWHFNLILADEGNEGAMFYIADIERESSIELLKEFIAKQDHPITNSKES